MSPDCNLLGCNLLAKTQACMCFAKCCIAGLVVFNCLVKSASVLICFLLLSSGLSLSLYIYIYACCRIGITLDGAKLMAKTHQVCWPACALPSVARVHAVKCWFAWSRVHLLSSVGGCLVKSASAFFYYVAVLWQVHIDES